MKRRCSIRCAWCRRAISSCRARLWRGCIILLCGLAALLAVSWFVLEWTDDGAESYPGGVVLRDGSGAVLRVSLGPGDVDCRPYYRADPDDWIVKALVAAEDGTYWSHCGVRPLSILRAAFQNLFYGRRISGASTITMQTVRLIRPHPKTFRWKFKEAVLALKMERARDKRWILSQYLNRAPYGSNFVGIEAAAAGWFGKSAKQLGIAEAAMLAGMVQAPTRFRPDRGFERAMKRREYVLGRMLEAGMITREQLEGARNVRPVVCRAARPFRYPHFCDWVLRQMGGDGAERPQGGDFVTTLDADIQETVDATVGAAAEKGGYSAAAVVMKVAGGEVVSLACSGDYFSAKAGQVNTALAPRPAGSTLKPFLVARALDDGFTTPGERLADVPMTFRGYRPANFDASYRGLVSVRDALVLSLNIPFVQLLNRLGLEKFGADLRSLGFRHTNDADEAFGLGMAIGNVEVTLMELVSAYAAVARGGVYRPPVALRRTGDAGDVRSGERIYSPGACYLVSEILSGVERSGAAFGHVADVRSPRFAWKTGTSSAYRDAWTVLWNPEYVVGVWCGHKSGGFGDKTLVGAKAAAPLAWTIARSLYPQNDGPWFVKPDDVVAGKICAVTGLPAGPFCPRVEQGSFLRGRSPSALCGRHRLDADGKAVELEDACLTAFSVRAAQASRLTILRPESNARFVLVPGNVQQRVVCQVGGNPEGSRLWWFVDGRSVGTTEGSRPFAVEMTVGAHTIVCSTAEGVTASVSIEVAQE